MTVKAQGDFDSPWKEAVEYYFKDFMAFFFPVIHKGVDWSRHYEFMDKELEKIVRDAQSGRRYADKLVKVYLADGREARLMIHIEIQGYRDASFAQRMYIYNYRIFDRYQFETVSIAVLTDDNPDFRPHEYKTGRWGCELKFRFPIAKVWDYRDRWQALSSNRNPFALVVMAHLKAIENTDGPIRKRQKLKLIRMLYDRGYSRMDVLELFRFIDWLLILPKDLDKQFWEELRRIEEEKQMPYVTSVERIGIEKGIEQGIQKGIQQGIQKGSLDQAREMLIEALSACFGEAPRDMRAAIQAIEDKERLKNLLRWAIHSDSIDAFRQHLISPHDSES